MANTTVALSETLTTTDDTSQAVPINYNTGNPSFDCSCCEFTRYQPVSSIGSGTGITFPITTCTIAYVKNLSPSGQAVTVTWSPTSGAAELVATLNVGDQITLFASPTGGTNPGITSLTLKGSASGALVEYLLAG